MKFVDPTQPYRKFGSWLFLKNRGPQQASLLGWKKSRTSRRLPVQSRSENALIRPSGNVLPARYGHVIHVYDGCAT
jgi:hypothetical protein